MVSLWNLIKNILPNLRGYLLALGLVAMATWLKYLAQPNIIPSNVPILYFVAIVPTAVFYGFGPAILVCILSLIAYDFFFIPPLYQFSLFEILNVPILVIFLVVGILLSYLSSNLRKKNIIAAEEIAARKQIETELVKYKDFLEDQVKQRTTGLQKAILGLENEITERKKLEEKNLLLSAIVESSDEVIISETLEGVITSWNKGADKIYGYTEAEVIGKSVLMLAPPEGAEEILHLLDQIKRGKTIQRHETLSVRKDGNMFPVSLSISPIFDSQGQIIAASSIAYDITERKKSEHMKDEFIGFVSHELKTPITVIMGAINTALSERISKKEAKELLGDAVSSAEDLANIVDNLLELSRAQANRMMIRREPVNITPIIRNVVDKLKRATKIHHLVVIVSESLPTVPVDAVRVERILNNLIENAIKYSPHGGNVTIFAQQKDDCIIVGVKDQGIGISRDDQARLFKLFARLGTVSGIGGTGLGLIVCRRLVEAHGGTIWLESEPNQGSTFFFTLPLIETPER
jgi:PAS domain S-box-containing protein